MIHRKMKMATVFWPNPCLPKLVGKRSVTAATPREICRFVRTRNPKE